MGHLTFALTSWDTLGNIGTHGMGQNNNGDKCVEGVENKNFKDFFALDLSFKREV